VRETLNGTHGSTPFGMEEAIDIKTALRSYTQWAAHTMFLEDRVGTIEVGKEADLAVWDQNPYTVPSAALKDLVCQMTFVRGRMVHRAEAAGPVVR
jgi:predicted amidohydrolase YtcJ